MQAMSTRARYRLCLPVAALCVLLGARAALAGSGLPDWLAPAPKSTPSGSPAARAFLKALSASDSTAEQRRQAWQELLEEGERPPKAVVRAVDAARRRAWKRLDGLIRSSAVRKAASGLRKAIARHQPNARSAVAAEGFSGEKLDRAMAPITEALEDAITPFRESEHFEAIRAVINEMEGYAVGCRLRHGWSDELLDTLCTLRFVAHHAGKPSWLDTVASNHRTGAWIDPCEHACIARLNWHRILLGIHPVHIDLRLVVAARKHSEEMVAKGYFSHESPTPALRSFGARAGREHTGAGGECIAGGGSSGVGAFRMWYYSQGHHKIMLFAVPAIGVGHCNGKWTLMMGGARMAGPIASKMAQYVRRRYQAGDDTDKLLALAKWCADNRLLTQARDELERLLTIDPDHRQARKALDRLHGTDAPHKK